MAILQLGYTTMSTAAELKFQRHNLATDCYSATVMRVIYAHKQFPACSNKISREKRPEDDKRWPGVISDFRAFEGPLQVEWRTRDGDSHSVVLNLDDIFRDKVVLHREDPQRIDQSMPMIPSNPIIVIEVHDRTLNVYMDVRIALRPTDPSVRTRDVRRNRTLAYSKTFETKE
jgi:hypothetical protein